MREIIIERFPSEELSKHIGLNIYKEYEGFRYNDSDFVKEFKYLRDKKLKTLEDFYYSKYSLFDNETNKHYLSSILNGMISKFNEHDINFFNKEWKHINSIKQKNRVIRSYKSEKRIMYDSIIEKFEKHFNYNIEFIMSFNTMSYINDNFNIINKEYLNNSFDIILND